VPRSLSQSVAHAPRHWAVVTMRVLLIYCHPREDSFCAALRDAATEALEVTGHVVDLRDLYAEGFAPALSREERGRYYDEGANLGDVERHVAALRRADAVLLVYPTWWFGMPAMLKGWLDRVWVPGVAFQLGTEAGALRPLLTNIRRIGVVTTYGSPRWLLWRVGWPDRRVVRHGLVPLCAPRCRLDWMALTRMDTCSRARRERFLAKLSLHLARWR
jgi:NAD(P)H dehydrogenase (quinone)